MAKWKVYSYEKCSTCKKAASFLRSVAVDAEVVDIKTSPPSKSELQQMMTYLGDRKKLLNTSGQLYRQMGLKDKLAAMTDEELLELLASEGMLVKRPFAISSSAGLVGFKEDQWSTCMASKPSR